MFVAACGIWRSVVFGEVRISKVSWRPRRALHVGSGCVGPCMWLRDVGCMDLEGCHRVCWDGEGWRRYNGLGWRRGCHVSLSHLSCWFHKQASLVWQWMVVKATQGSAKVGVDRMQQLAMQQIRKRRFGLHVGSRLKGYKVRPAPCSGILCLRLGFVLTFRHATH